MIRNPRTYRRPAPKPNVLIVIDTEIVSGPGKGLFQFLRHARAEAFNYTLCTFEAGWDPRREFADEARRRRLQLCSLSQRWRFDPTPLWQAARVVRRRAMNLVQTHGYKANVVGLFLQRLLRLPWIAFAHGWTAEGRRIAWYNRVDHWLMRHPDRVVAVSQAMADRLCALGVSPRRVALIPNAVDRADFDKSGLVHEDLRKRFGIGSRVKLIGVIGRLSREKGQRYALEALRQLSRNSLPQAKVLFAGDGPDRRALEARARAEGLADRVIFAGHLTDAAAIYRAIDVCVLPSLSEGLPNVVLEAMLYSKPVVATAVGGVPEVIRNGENGLLVPPGDAAVLAEAIATLLGDADFARRLASKGARSLYPAFDPAKRAKQILRLYGELLGTLRRRSEPCYR